MPQIARPIGRFVLWEQGCFFKKGWRQLDLFEKRDKKNKLLKEMDRVSEHLVGGNPVGKFIISDRNLQYSFNSECCHFQGEGVEMETFVGTVIDDCRSCIGPSKASSQFKKFLASGTFGFEQVLHERPHHASPPRYRLH